MVRLQDLGQRKDMFMLDPRLLVVDHSWNVRLSNGDLDAHISMLMASILQIGVTNPLTIYMNGEEPTITDGFCRHTAVMRLIAEGHDIKKVPVISESKLANEADRVLSMITRNSGLPLTTLEKAQVFKRLVALGWSNQEIQAKTGYSDTQVANILMLSAAEPEVQTMVQEGQISASLAVQAIRSKGPEAGAALTGAVEAAKARGKSKATPQDLVVPLPRPRPPKAPAIPAAVGNEKLPVAPSGQKAQQVHLAIPVSLALDVEVIIAHRMHHGHADGHLSAGQLRVSAISFLEAESGDDYENLTEAAGAILAEMTRVRRAKVLSEAETSSPSAVELSHEKQA